MLIKFDVGDWSDDGHGKNEVFYAETAKTVQDVREAHFNAPKVLGFDIGNICSEYEDDTLPDNVVTKLEELQYQIESIECVGPEEIFNIWVFLLNYIDPTLEIIRHDIGASSVVFYGYDEKNRHLNSPGYGCY